MRFLSPFLMALALVSSYSAQLVDDRAITLRTAEDVKKMRGRVIEYIWGKDGFPERVQPNQVVEIPSPVQGLTNLNRVEEMRMHLGLALDAVSWHFVPERANGELVVVHHGHGCTMDDDSSAKEVGYGLQRTINALLREGYGVLGVFMPHMRPGDCTGAHEALMQMKPEGSPLRYFLEPTAISLNYVKHPPKSAGAPSYRAFHMVGLSGGGWTTTMYAAVDSTIRCNFPVAGSIPLYLRTGGSVGDREQFESSFYRMAGYPDLYLLGAHGAGRSQVQIVLRRDDCCFGERQHDQKSCGMSYEDAMRSFSDRVREALTQTRAGAYRLEIDEVAPSHMISHHAIDSIILPELRRNRGVR